MKSGEMSAADCTFSVFLSFITRGSMDGYHRRIYRLLTALYVNRIDVRSINE